MGGGRPLVTAHWAGSPVGAARRGSGGPASGRPVGGGGPCWSIVEDDGFVVPRRPGTATPGRCVGGRWVRPVLVGLERLVRPPSRLVTPVPFRECEGDPEPVRVGLADPPDRLDALVGRPVAAPAPVARPRDELLVPDDLDGLAPAPVLRGGRDPVAPWPLRGPVPRIAARAEPERAEPERAEPDEAPERDWRAGPAGLAGRAEPPDRDDWARRFGCEERGGTSRVYKCRT